MEKRNYDKRIVNQLKDENDQILTNFKDVNKRIEDHFSKILNSKIVENGNVQRVNFNQFAKDVVIPRLTYEKQIEMESDLTMENFMKPFWTCLEETFCIATTNPSTKNNSQSHKEEESSPSYQKVTKT